MGISELFQKTKAELAMIVVLVSLSVQSASSQKPELMIQAGHASYVYTVAFSPDGRTLASASLDSTIKVWDVASGKLLQTFRGHSSYVTNVKFTPDGRSLVSSSEDHTLKLWDLNTGKDLRTFTGHSETIWALAVSPDGKMLASGGEAKTIKLWDIETGRELVTLNGHGSWVTSLAFSPDSTTLASASYDKTVKLWDVGRQKEVRTLNGHSKGLVSVTFSPDGRTVASAGWDKSVRLWDAKSGTALRTLAGHSDAVWSISFSPDGKTLASGSYDKTIKLWNIETGIELNTLTGHTDILRSVAFSPNGAILASSSGDTTIRLWDVSAGREIKILTGRSSPTTTRALISPDGKTVASGHMDNTIKIWDLETGKEPRILTGHSYWVLALVFSPDGKILASGGDENIKLWDVAAGKELRTLKGHSNLVTKLSFSPDGRTLASASQDKTVKLWDVESGRELKSLTGHAHRVQAVAFSPDGTILASGSEDKTIKLWDTASGTELRTLVAPSKVYSVAFSPDGKTLASANLDNNAFLLWDLGSGKVVKEIFSPRSTGSVIGFSLDGKTLATTDLYKAITYWDIGSGNEMSAYHGRFGYAEGSFSPDGTLTVIREDSAISLIEVATRKELCSLTALTDDDWLVTTPDGLFDGTPKAWAELDWRFDGLTFSHAPVEAFFNEFYYPGLLPDLLKGKRPKPPGKDLTTIDIRQPKVDLAAIGSAVPVERAVKIGISISDNRERPRQDGMPVSSGARDLRLFRNGSLVKVWHGDVLKGKESATIETTVPIVAGENKFTAYSFNNDNVKSSDAMLTVTGADGLKRKGTAYVLAMGVNEYANSQYNLTYAVPDAQDFSSELKRQQERLGVFEHAEIVLLLDGAATKANILRSLASIAARVRPEDSLTIYFAGHGTAQANRFYLIPHDLGYVGDRTRLDKAGLQIILSHSISDEELESAIEGIDAAQMLLVVDACNSGQALESDEKRRGPMNSKGLAQLAYEKGMYILTAAQSYQAAQEAAKFGHGFLTYALVEEGLKTPAADRAPKDGQILLREWLDFATERVPEMQKADIKTRELTREKTPTQVKPAEIYEIQQPRVFYRRETDAHSMIIARP